MLAVANKKPRRPPTLQSVHISAPVGGLNTVDPALGLPELDCLKLYNLTAAEFGLRVRTGSKEWVTGLTGASDNTVRTTMPFSGGQKNGGTDKLFACTQAGIWDCTPSSTTPEHLITFATQTGDAGYGTFCVFTTPGGRFLLYCDEENGLFLYTETTNSWAIGASGTTQLWVANTSYVVGNKVMNGGKEYVCTVAGTSAGSGGPTGTVAGAITDGTVTWNYVRTEQTWFGSTDYLVDDTVINFEKLYICTVAGTSAASGGPTATPIVDGTVTWDYTSAATAWLPHHTYAVGENAINGGNIYVCTTGGKSDGSGGPTGTGTGIIDLHAVWDYAGTSWQPTTVYATGDKVTNGGNLYTCSVGGTSDGSGGPTGTGTGTSVVDGTVTWDYVAPHVARSTYIGMSLADETAGFNGTAANFAAVMAWKNRVWLVEKDATRAWYLATNAVYGTATSFDFGSKMRAGGPLANLYDWSYDAGGGLDSKLVGISTAGDVVIYQGTDPNSASTFGLYGAWSVGGVPYGRRIATDYGGELLVVSLLGVVPLSKLIVGQPVVAGDRSSYATDKISNDFNRLASTYQTNQGWSIGLHPQDNALIVLVPTVSGTAATPYAMSFGKRSWSVYRDLPILSMAVWNGTTYFGTPDGRVCQSFGYIDGVTLADPDSFSPIAWSLLTAYRNGGTPKQKRVQWVKVSVEAQEPTPAINAEAKYNLDLSEASAPSGVGIGGPGTWDNSVWDADVWGGDYVAYQPIIGTTGMGAEVAIAVCGVATSRTSFVGVDVNFDVAEGVL